MVVQLVLLMATEEPFISLPAIHDRGSLGQVDLDAEFEGLKRNRPQDSRIERYLESTEVHLTGQILKWEEHAQTDAFGRDGGPLMSHHSTADNSARQNPAVCRNGVRSKTEPVYRSFPLTKDTTNDEKPRTWCDKPEAKHLRNNTWPRYDAKPELPNSKERDKSGRIDPFGRIHRENLDFIARQTKQAYKLTHDNMAAKETLRKAQDVIEELRAKINRRNTHIKDRREKEGDLVELVESLRRARDEKLQEYKSLVKGMNEALKEKEQLLEQMEGERAKAEMLYQRQLTENTELLRKIEAREKAIKTLREKTGKVKKWKDEARS